MKICTLTFTFHQRQAFLGYSTFPGLHKAANYGLTCYSVLDNGQQHIGEIFMQGGLGYAWMNHLFMPNACNYCDDAFAECADVALMDAWLPEYSKDCRGRNLVVVRRQDLQLCLRDGVANQELCLEDISIDRVIESQKGGLLSKRSGILSRRAYDKARGRRVPCGRLHLYTPRPGFIDRLKYIDVMKKSRSAANLWLESRRDLKEFSRRMKQCDSWEGWLANVLKTSKTRLRRIIKIAKKLASVAVSYVTR